jgi:hypothetical protein
VNPNKTVEVIAVIGTRRVGSTVARGAIPADYRVLVAGSGSPENLGLTVDYVIPGAQPRWASDAVAEADLVILAVPFGRFPSLPLAALADKAVLDIMNHWPPVDGAVPHIDREASTSEALVHPRHRRSRGLFLGVAPNRACARRGTQEGSVTGRRPQVVMSVLSPVLPARTVLLPDY